MALRVPAFRKAWEEPAGSHSAATTNSSGRRADFLGPRIHSPRFSRRSAPAAERTTTSASRAASTGSVSPAGEQVPRLPPSVPALRIWGEPTVRAA